LDLEPLDPQASTFSDWFERWVGAWQPRSEEQFGSIDDSASATHEIGHLLRRIERALEIRSGGSSPVDIDDFLGSFSIVAVWEFDRVDERLSIISIRLERFYLNTIEEDADPEVSGSAFVGITIGAIDFKEPPLAFEFECTAHIHLEKEPTLERRARSEEFRAFEEEFGRSVALVSKDEDDEVFEDTKARAFVLPHLAESVIDFVRRKLASVDRLSSRHSEPLSNELERDSTDHGAVAALVGLEDEIWRLEAEVAHMLREGSVGMPNLATKLAALKNSSLRLRHDIPSSCHESPYLWQEEHPLSLTVIGAMPRTSGKCRATKEQFLLPPDVDPFSGLTADPGEYDFELTFMLDIHAQVILRILEPHRTPKSALRAGSLHCSRGLSLPDLSRWLLERLWAGIRLAKVEVSAFSIGATERLLETELWNKSSDAIWPTPDRPRQLPF
jgi:hypothetical protein